MKRIACVLSLALACGLLAGCSSDKAEEPASSASASAKQEAPSYRTIGNDTEGAAEILFTNGLSQNIEAIYFVSVSGGVQSNIADFDGPIAAGETVKLCYTPGKAGSDSVQVMCADGTPLSLEDIALSNIAEMTLVATDDVAYVDYVDVDGAKGSTKQAALERKAAAEAAAAAQAEAEAAAAQAAAEAAAVEEQQTYQEPSYSEPTYSEPAPSQSPAGPSQSEDQCVEGGVALR